MWGVQDEPQPEPAKLIYIYIYTVYIYIYCSWLVPLCSFSFAGLEHFQVKQLGVHCQPIPLGGH